MLLLTCEHATNRVPQELMYVFEGHEDALTGHRGWDPGAFGLALAIHETTRAPLGFTDVSRLLVEGNRYEHIWSAYTDTLTDEQRERVRLQYHAPFLCTLDRAVADTIARGEKIEHLSVHTFTPVLDGIVRDVDIGVLGDPKREGTRMGALAARLSSATRLRVRINAPYDGRMESTMAYLRARHPRGYSGVALEVNQGLLENGAFPPGLTRAIARSV